MNSATPSPLAASSSSAEPPRAAWLGRSFSPREKLALIREVLTTYVTARRLLKQEVVADAVGQLRAGAPPDQPVHLPYSHAEAARLGKVVLRTLAPLPTDTRCLARSLVLTGLLARRGISSQLVIGVAPGATFRAHAWVEHAGYPVLPSGAGEYERLLEL